MRSDAKQAEQVRAKSLILAAANGGQLVFDSPSQ